MNKHWTGDSLSDYQSWLSLGFCDQILEKMESLGLTQVQLAQRTGLTEGRIWQILHGRGNLTLKTMIRLAQAVGLKVGVVAYDDGDPENARGPISSDLLRTCWEQCGCPTSFDEVRSLVSRLEAVNEGSNFISLKLEGLCQRLRKLFGNVKESE